METNGSSHDNMYEEFEPFCVWHRFADREILELHLQGFKKENLRVKVTDKNILTVTGERPLADGKKHSRFEKKIELSNNINTKEIQAKFGGCTILSLIMPKKQPNDITKHEEKEDDDNLTSQAMKDGNQMAMKVKRCGKMGVIVVVLAAIVVGFGAFVAHKYRTIYQVED